MRKRSLLFAALPVVAFCQQGAITPQATIRLFDGKTLDAFTTWQRDAHESDPDKVFSVVDQIDGAPAIRISGRHFGGLITKAAYRDYKLVAEFRWGAVTWGARSNSARDSGILLHGQGRPGSTEKDMNGAWMRSVEFQIIEGGVGDVILVEGYTDNGERLRPTLECKTRKDRDGETIYDPNGQLNVYSEGRINWRGRSEDWVDKLGFRAPADVEHPAGEWNLLEAIVRGGSVQYFVNGVLVNEGVDGSLTEGRILLQSEGAEIYFRRIDLQPLP
ncbi:MAG TPA: DUF1080 domain-containing protein [Bryobacteraceae bacterium]|nr:DUF1080 domain-containing protein [Bryobacteraceae bacterium]